MPGDEVSLLDVHATLKLLKPSRLTVNECDDFAIEHKSFFLFRSECGQCVYNLRKLSRLVLSVAGDEAHISGRGECKHAHAVILRLERPAVTRDMPADRCIHRLEAACDLGDRSSSRG